MTMTPSVLPSMRRGSPEAFAPVAWRQTWSSSCVALARALYSGASIVVLDDPLAAMDANIGHRVFQQGIVSDMCGRGTAVLLTNQVHLGKFASRILLLGRW